MINERKMITIIAGTFMFSMMSILLWTYRKQLNNITRIKRSEKLYIENALNKDKFSTALNDTEKRITESINEGSSRQPQSQGNNLEPGILL